ncbi:antifungal defensin [Fusarium heterosporum]|uniref:Antifungal defensin n=1 Tax=Fusarium heterosporum TaxID=42747 RepID=A0A8H5WLA5_FUSHE|nr:antifungal defensin [Fusarium heterosporum]
MLLNQIFLGALFAISSVSAIPNPNAEQADVDVAARSLLHHCGKHASYSHSKKECVCHDDGKIYHSKHKKCECPKGEKFHHIERKCKK